MPIVCLAMILKNQVETIETCIDSVRPWIDHYCLIDAGSSDGTIALALGKLRGVEGHVYQHPWIHSEPKVQELFRLGRAHGEYLLWCFPEERLTVTDPCGFGPLEKDCYYAICREGGLDWRRPFLLRSKLEWEGGDFLPQDLHSPEMRTGLLLLESILWREPVKEADKFREALDRDPANPRLLFHLARVEDTLELYEKRVLLGGDAEEVFYCLYRIAALLEKRGEPLERVIEAYLKAYHFLPSRAEPLYDLANRMIRDENYILAYVLAEYALTLPKPEDPFFLKSWIYEHGLREQLVLSGKKIQRNVS